MVRWLTWAVLLTLIMDDTFMFVICDMHDSGFGWVAVDCSSSVGLCLTYIDCPRPSPLVVSLQFLHIDWPVVDPDGRDRSPASFRTSLKSKHSLAIILPESPACESLFVHLVGSIMSSEPWSCVKDFLPRLEAVTLRHERHDVSQCHAFVNIEFGNDSAIAGPCGGW